MTIEAAARRLAAMGFPLVPTCRPGSVPGSCSARWHDHVLHPKLAGKVPLAKGYPARAAHPPSADEVAAEVRRHQPCNIAIVTGAGIIAVDADSPAAEVEVQAFLTGVATVTRERRPGRGRVWLFTVPVGVQAGNRAKIGRSEAIDVRGNSGIVVIPPGLHISGHLIGWVPGRAPWEMPLAPIPAGLLEFITPKAAPSASATATEPVIGIRPGDGRVPGYVRFLLSSSAQLHRLWCGEGKTGGDTSRSGYDYAIARELLRRRCSPADTVAAILVRPRAHRNDPAYALETVRKAMLAAGRSR